MTERPPAERTDDIDPITRSPDGESRALLARVGDAFPLDPHTRIQRSSTEAPSSTRPWGLRYAQSPSARAQVITTVETAVYDPVRQVSIDRLSGEPVLKHAGGTRETTGTTDGQGPSPEEDTKD
ncbi:putative ATP-grasp-modified RiPP [Halostreptopolyspora alba]|uniref:Putative ATP-grasp-modified RiPP n=1 Tax=Halostreptopolyspora alba TaxID=2487137 RepID=A0A3N0E885_9ACTN|nr:putative ATP-grasp-modified RiPP [Nocardiopsaceae bacterium YIM 96095]